MTQPVPASWTADELLAEIIALTSLPARQPGDITVYDLAEATGIPIQTAENRLKRLVRDGVLATDLVVDPATSRRVRVYRKMK
jgi:DNA-binding Lrp family transcriptional regulator